MKVFRVIVVILTVATFVQVAALSYIQGYEAGQDSQMRGYIELYVKVYGDVCTLMTPYPHPLRNTLFSTSLLLLICWLFAAMYVVQRKAGSKPQVESKEVPQQKQS